MGIKKETELTIEKIEAFSKAALDVIEHLAATHKGALARALNALQKAERKGKNPLA